VIAFILKVNQVPKKHISGTKLPPVALRSLCQSCTMLCYFLFIIGGVSYNQICIVYKAKPPMDQYCFDMAQITVATNPSWQRIANNGMLMVAQI